MCALIIQAVCQKKKKNSLLGSQASEEIQVQVSITAAPLTQMFPEVEVR